MNNPFSTDSIVESSELDALISFTQTRWNGLNKSDSSAIITASFQAGLQAGALLFDEYGFSDASQSWELERESQLTASLSNQPDQISQIYYDDVLTFGKDFNSYAGVFYRIVTRDWDYSAAVDAVYLNLLSLYPASTSFKPNGWDQLYSTYAEFDGADGYYESGQQKFDIDDFSGCNSVSSGADGFHAKIALHATMYNDVCQGRNPIRTLIAAAFSHGLFVAKHNNTIAAINDMQRCKGLLFSTYPNNISFINHHDVHNIPSNKILKAIQFCASFSVQHNIDTTPGFREYNDQDGLTKYISSRILAIKQSEHNPAQSKEDSDAWLDGFFSEINSPEYIQSQKDFDASLYNSIKKFLSTTNKASPK